MVALKAGGVIPLHHCGLVLDWSVLAAPKCEHEPNGDGYAIWRQENGLLFAVGDGSGSGELAADAVERCFDSLADSKGELDTDFKRCHEALKRGRGAALALIRVSAETGVMTWASVGDVDGVLMRRTQGNRALVAAITRIGGTLGITFTTIVPGSHRLEPGDMIVVTTDGVLRAFAQEVALNQSADATVRQILQEFRRPNDDSLVLAIEVMAR